MRVGSLLVGLAAVVAGSGGAAPDPLEQVTGALPTAVEVRESLARGRYVEAEAAARRQLAQARSAGQTSLAAAEAMDLLVEVLVAEGSDGTLESRELAETSLSIKERSLGPNDAGYAWTLALVGEVGSDVARRRTQLERALEIQEAAPGSDPLKLAWTLYHLGALGHTCPDHEPGALLVERALRIRERELGPSHPDTLRALAYSLAYGDPQVCLEGLTTALDGLEREGRGEDPVAAELWRFMAHCHGIDPTTDFGAIRNAFQRALEIDLSRLGPDSTHTASDHLGLGRWHTSMLEFEIAGEHFALARTTFERAFGPDSTRLLPLLAAQARHAVQADLDEAESLLRRALTLRAAAYGFDCPSYIDLAFDYATWLKDRGDCPRAREILEPTLEYLEQYSESANLAWSLHHMGEVTACMGNDVRALSYFEESLAVWERVAGREALTLWVLLLDLGDVNTRLGNHAIAEAQLRRSIALLERDLGPEYAGVGTGLWLLGKNYEARSEWARAREVLDRALYITELEFGATGKRTGLVLRELCSVHLALGELDAARGTCERALGIAVDKHGAGHPYHAAAAARLAAVLMAQGARAESLSRAVEAENVARSYFLRTARHLSEREALGLRDLKGTRHPGLDVALSIVASGREVPDDAVNTVCDQLVRSRAIVLDEVAARHVASLTAVGPARELVRKLEAARDAHSRLVVRSFSPDGQVTARQLEQAAAQIDLAERELAATDAVFGQSIERSRTGLADVLRTLPARTALVSYVKYWRMTSSAPLDRTSSYLAFVRSPGQPGAAVVDLGPAERIEKLVEAWRSELDTPPTTSVRLERARSYEQAGAALREAVWDPVRARIAGAELALVVPDGALHLVNVGTLPSTPGRYVVEDAPVLHLLSAERDVAALSRATAPGSGLLLVGAPAFDLDPRAVEDLERQTLSSLPEVVASAPVYRGPPPSCVNSGPQALQPLPRALFEVDQVASIWTAGASEAALTPVIKLVDDRAAEGAFKRLVPGRRVVHVATHGFFGDIACVAPDSSSPIDSRLLTLAGLAFAGADWRNEAGPDREDGILTADEVASLDLTRAEWVVLSACDSGVGRSVQGEGVMGLRRAFQTAGARTLVMSLWRVQDDAASQWMTRLYSARARHESTSAAVRSATLELLAARRERGLDTHPYYWGAFVAAGDWR